MRNQISKWGNSLALRLPKSVAADAQLREGTAVELRVVDGALVVRPARPKYRLSDLLGEHGSAQGSEFDWGRASGEEAW